MSERKLANWLMAYGEFTQGTESPAIFHSWVGLATLAGAMQRKIHLPFGHFAIYPNLFVVLVSPPGRSRKSSALRIGQGLLESAQDWGATNIHFSTQSSSQAALVQQLAKIEDKTNQSLTAFSSELGSLLGSKSVEIVDFLVDIYDCNPNWSKQTVSRGLEKIEKPWLNLIAATTPQWMGDNLSSTAVEGGFVSRTLFVYCDERLLVAIPELTDQQRETKKDLIHDLALIAELKGEMVLSPEARDFYIRWYEDPSRLNSTMDQRLTTFYDREHVQVLKLSMIIRMAEDNSMVIQEQDVRLAIGLIDQIKPGMHRAFTAVGKNPYSTSMEKIRDLLKHYPDGLTHKKLFAASWTDLDVNQFDGVMQALTATGEVENKGGKYILVRQNGTSPSS